MLRVTDHAIILFVDAKPGGVNRITPSLIAAQPNGEEACINRLASDATHGMTFGSGFLPDLAILVNGSNTGTDPYNSDSDGDGYSDSAEIAGTTGLGYPSNPNTSNAFIGWAISYFGFPASPTDDPDADGLTNYQEFLFGTSPIEPSGSFCQTENSPSGLVMHWLQRSTGVRYWLEETTDPATQPWSLSPATIEDDPDQSNVPADGNYIRKSATIPIGPPRKFLRIAALE